MMGIISNNIKWLRGTGLLVIGVFLLFGAPLHAGENSHYSLANGLNVTVISPENVMKMTSTAPGGALLLNMADGQSYQLIASLSDPEITNTGDGRFHPFDEDLVIKALSAIDVGGRPLNLSVNVYLLPLPREGFLTSSACGSDIFLSPGVYEISAASCAYFVAHEMGHVFQNAYLPVGGSRAWTDYLKLRGIYDDPRYVETCAHASRPGEIFAEDFRYLFGGPEARSSGTIENAELSLPDAVAGLREFIVDLVPSGPAVAAAPPAGSRLVVSNYPNPFNPVTTIRASLGGVASGPTTEADVAVYRVDGSLVRRVFHGSVSGDELSVRWDGRDERGKTAASGVYFYVVRCGQARATGKMLLVR
jgi:hypothetical protein